MTVTKRRLSVLLAVAIVVAVVVGGLAYTRFRGNSHDDTMTKAEDTTPPAPLTKATTPARQLNEKERLLVGKWKFVKVTPPHLPRSHEETFEYEADGSCTSRSQSKYHGPRVQRGTFKITGDLMLLRLGTNEGGVQLIEELTEDRLVLSAPNGTGRWIEEWVRVRPE